MISPNYVGFPSQITFNSTHPIILDYSPITFDSPLYDLKRTYPSPCPVIPFVSLIKIQQIPNSIFFSHLYLHLLPILSLRQSKSTNQQIVISCSLNNHNIQLTLSCKFCKSYFKSNGNDTLIRRSSNNQSFASITDSRTAPPHSVTSLSSNYI